MKIRILILGCVCIALFGAGLFLGRSYPAHHYEKIATGPYLLDSATGKICTINYDPNASTNIFDNPSAANKPAIPYCPK